MSNKGAGATPPRGLTSRRGLTFFSTRCVVGGLGCSERYASPIPAADVMADVAGADLATYCLLLPLLFPWVDLQQVSALLGREEAQ